MEVSGGKFLEPLSDMQKECLKEVICKDCGKKWMQRIYVFKKWKGRCRKCAMKELGKRPEQRKRISENSKRQVLRQGGIPNAVKFTGQKGCLAPHWIDGRTPENVRERHSKKYFDWRKQVFVRDGFKCQICEKVGGKLNAHHICEWHKYKDLRFAIDNGITLCEDCHKKIHHKFN
jgi:hypothetical protein